MKPAYLSLRQRFLRWMVLVFVIASTALMAQPAQASHTLENHCIASSGTDLNVLFGISQQIVASFCKEVNSGEYWIAVGGPPWLMSTSFEAVPVGFVSAGSTPLEDFLAKFVAVKYVIDPGTFQERTYVFPTSNKLWIGTIEGFPAVHPITLGALKPLNVGEHVVQVYWVFSAMHCDGFGAVIEENCLGPGEIQYGPPRAFEVTPGAAQSP